MRSWRSLVLAGLLLGCGDAGVDSAGECAEAIVMTWDSHGVAILTAYCQPCHASGSTLRYGAPEDVTFDDYDQAMAWRDRILATATVDEPTMPPSTPMDPIDQENLRIWLTCWE